VEVGGVVTALDLLARRSGTLRDLEVLEQHGEALACLHVRLGRVELGERGVAD
jgi:hypothetical protein